jgi:hypothetical protein
MPIKKTKISRKSKRFMKKMLSRKKTQKNKGNMSKSRSSSKSNSLKMKKMKMRKIRNMRNMRKSQRGGYAANCNMATVKEPGFTIDALGSIEGINIPSTRASIYRPNCNTSSPQAMAP